jgi:hypothetical protein
MTPRPVRLIARRRLAPLAAVLLAAVWAWPSRAVAGPATVPAADSPVVTVQAALVQLDRYACFTGVAPERVMETLGQGTDAITVARKGMLGTEAAIADAPRAKPGTPDADAAMERRTAACQFDFLQAELLRRAAVALPVEHPRRALLLQQALDGYKALRVEYRDLAVGRLGYAGEARVHRAAGDLAQADAALAPVIGDLHDRRLAQQSPAVLPVQRVLWLERVETALARNLGDGEALAAKVRQSPVLADASPADQAALQWLTVQARARATLGQPGRGGTEKLAAELRNAELAKFVPDPQRLGLLARLSRDGGVALLPTEQLQLARIQAAAGMPDAAATAYAAIPADQLTPQDSRAYGLLLYSLGRHATAAEVLARALSQVRPENGDRVRLLQAYAAARLQVARDPKADAAARTAAIDAMGQLARATTDPAVRRDALRSWAYLNEQAGTFDPASDVLAAGKSDVDNDPYLYVLTAQSRWRAAQARRSRGDAPSAETLASGKTISSDLQRLLPKAEPELAPALVLLMAQIAAGTPDAGPKVALDLLRRHEPLLKADAPSAPQLAALKLELLMELGLTDEAESVAARLAPEALPATTSLQLAGMLARRYGQSADVPQQRGEIRQRVVRLAQHALARQGPARYRQTAVDAARLLLQVDAFADVRAILSGIAAGTGGTTVPAGDDAETVLLLAQAMQGEGQADAARRLLEAATRDHPESGPIQLAMGRFQQGLKQWDAAAAAYRAARERLAPGGGDWWQATLGLADVLVQSRRPQAAVEIVRVANTLYRATAPAATLPRIDELLRTPAAPAAASLDRKD